MKITLRQDHEYQAKLNQVIKTIEEEMPRYADIMYVDDKEIESTINDVNSLLDEMLVQHMSCITSLKILRLLVGDANNIKYINNKLTEINFLERKRAINKRLSQNTIRPFERIVKAKLDAKRENRERYNDEFNVSIFDVDDINDFKTETRRCDRRIRELKEEVLALNITTYVEVDDKVEATLKLHHII